MLSRYEKVIRTSHECSKLSLNGFELEITKIKICYMNKKKILLAEDNQFILRSFKHLLGEQGYAVETVCDGAFVVSAVKDSRPDVLVLDLILPNKNGFDILKEIRLDKKFDALPIIVATNLGQDEDKEKVMNLGATDYIIKSQITSKDLLEKIEQVIREFVE